MDDAKDKLIAMLEAEVARLKAENGRLRTLAKTALVRAERPPGVTKSRHHENAERRVADVEAGMPEATEGGDE